MGYNSTASTLTLTAKLTPIGRQKILTNSIGVISRFSLGDSDANYNTIFPLTTGNVPATGGDIGPDSSATNSTNDNLQIRSWLWFSPTNRFKYVEAQSGQLAVSTESLGMVTISGTSLTHDSLTRTNYTDEMTNLFYTFGLPITTTEQSY